MSYDIRDASVGMICEAVLVFHAIMHQLAEDSANYLTRFVARRRTCCFGVLEQVKTGRYMLNVGFFARIRTSCTNE